MRWSVRNVGRAVLLCGILTGTVLLVFGWRPDLLGAGLLGVIVVEVLMNAVESRKPPT